MKKFLKRLFLFAAVAGVPAAFWCAFVVWMDFSSYGKSLEMPDGAHVVVCGDSQTKDALDPAVVPGLFNFSNAASLHDQNIMRLEDLFKANPGRIDTVLVDISPLKLGYNPSIPLSQTAAARVHFLLHVRHLGENRRSAGSWTALVRDVVFTRKFNEFRKSILRGEKWRSSNAGGFAPDKTHGFTNPRYAKRALADVESKAARVNALPPADGSEKLFSIVSEEIALVRANGARPVLTVMPLSPRLLAAIDPARLAAFRSSVRAFAAKERVSLVDCLDHPTDEGDWHDANHLNRAGAASFSRAFVLLLEAARAAREGD